MIRWGMLVLLLCAVPAAAAPPDGVRIRFAALGDVPYKADERLKLATDLLRLPAQAAFAVHLGDIKAGTPFCREGEYSGVARILRGSPVPLLVLPGDNEWNDCSRPDRAWSYWMAHLHRFEQHWPGFGPIQRQPGQPANFAFTRNRVVFIGLHLVGGRVHDRQEWDTRHADNLDWLQTHLRDAPDPASGKAPKAAVVFGHSQPSKATADFFEAFSRLVVAFDRPVLYLHGDGHRWVKDRPFKARNLQRVQVDQGGRAPPVIVSVMKDRQSPFRFERR